MLPDAYPKILDQFNNRYQTVKSFVNEQGLIIGEPMFQDFTRRVDTLSVELSQIISQFGNFQKGGDLTQYDAFLSSLTENPNITSTLVRLNLAIHGANDPTFDDDAFRSLTTWGLYSPYLDDNIRFENYIPKYANHVCDTQYMNSKWIKLEDIRRSNPDYYKQQWATRMLSFYRSLMINHGKISTNENPFVLFEWK